MALRYVPTITIDGARIREGWDGGNVAAVDELTIVWGRTDLYAKPQPSSLTVEVIDPDGSWATNNALVGKRIVIGRTDPDRAMFRGTIRDVEVYRDVVAFRSTFGTIETPVWRASIAATDVRADLDAAVIKGFALDGSGIWEQATPKTRVEQIASAAAGIVSGVQPISDVLGPDTPEPRWMRSHTLADKLSLLNHLERCYAFIPLAHVNYDANANTIAIGRPATSKGMKLGYIPGRISMAPVAGYSLPAAAFQVDDKAALRSTAQAAIDTVTLDHYDKVLESFQDPFGGTGWRPVPADAAIQATVPGTSKSTVQNELEIVTDAYVWVNAPTPFPAQIVADTAALVAGLNGQFTMPQLHFDFARFDLGDPAIDDVLLDTRDRDVPLFFAGSMFAALSNTGPQHQLIGGTTRWGRSKADKRGWTVDMTLAPAVPAAPGNLTLAQLVTNATPTLSEFDPSISLADLGLITTGLT